MILFLFVIIFYYSTFLSISSFSFSPFCSLRRAHSFVYIIKKPVIWEEIFLLTKLKGGLPSEEKMCFFTTFCKMKKIRFYFYFLFLFFLFLFFILSVLFFLSSFLSFSSPKTSFLPFSLLSSPPSSQSNQQTQFGWLN